MSDMIHLQAIVVFILSSLNSINSFISPVITRFN